MMRKNQKELEMLRRIKEDFGENMCGELNGLCGRVFARCVLNASPDSLETCYSLTDFMQDEGITDRAEADRLLEDAFLLIFAYPFYDKAGIFSGALVALDKRDEDIRKFYFSSFCHDYLKKFDFIASDK